MVISFPYTGSLSILVFISWIPLLLTEASISQKNYRSGKVLIHAYITFLVYNLGTTWWVIYASPEGAAMAFIVNSLIMALVFYMFHLTKKFVGTKEGYLALIFYWLAFEYFHYNWDSSWPWLSLGNTFSIHPSWIQWYSYSGVLGGSLWILVINLLLFRAFQNVYLNKENWKIQTPFFILSGLGFLIPMTISLISFYTYEEKKDPIEVVAIQPNIDPYDEKFESSIKGQLEKLFHLAARKVRPETDLMVAPETALSGDFDANGATRDYSVNENFFEKTYPYHFITENQRKLYDVPLLIGASTYRVFENKHSHASREAFGGGFFEQYNSMMLLNKGDVDIIHKSKLVPGVETIPFASTFPFLEELSIDLGGTRGTLGIEPEPKIFKIDHIRIAPSICYESVFGEFIAIQCRKGADLICIATNDGWWKNTPGYKQHRSFASLRAIENRRSVVRAANTGTSCFIDQRGVTRQETKWWVPAVIRDTVNLNNEKTFYTMWGDVFGRTSAFVSVLLILLTFVRRFKRFVSPNG